MRLSISSLLSLPAAMMLFSLPAAAAGIGVGGYASSDYPARQLDFAVSSGTPGTGGLSLAHNDGPNARFTGRADFGVLHLTINTHAESDGVDLHQSAAGAIVEWADELTFSGTTAADTLFFNTGFWALGSVSTTASQYGLSTTNLVWQFEAWDAANINRVSYSGQHVTRSNGFNEGTNFLNTFIPLSFPVYGTPGSNVTRFRLLFTAGASASALFPGQATTASSTVDLGDTVLWGGITVTDADHQVVSGTVASQTGFDWTVEQTDAPDPGSMFLLGGGMLLLAGKSLRRRG